MANFDEIVDIRRSHGGYNGDSNLAGATYRFAFRGKTYTYQLFDVDFSLWIGGPTPGRDRERIAYAAPEPFAYTLTREGQARRPLDADEAELARLAAPRDGYYPLLAFFRKHS